MGAALLMQLEPAAAELVWSRPLGLAALALPVLLVLLARTRREPSLVATGTLAVWREIEALAPAVAQRSRPRVPPATWLFVVALALGAVGLAGPRVVAPEGPRTWTIVVDDAASTGLPLRPGGDETRRARALDDALAWLAKNAEPHDVVRWIRGDGEERVLRADEAPDRAWLARARVGGARDLAARLAALDRPGTIAVSDRAPDPRPAHAGWFASGGAAVPGAIAASAEALIVWDGESLVERPAPGAAGRVVLDASEGEIPALVSELVEVWAGARGVAVVRGRAEGRLPEGRLPEGRLVVRGRASDGRSCVGGRDGWRVRAGGTGGVEGWERVAGLSGWLAARTEGGERAALIGWAPGRIEVSARELDVIDGDPASVAVSFAELFDAALLPHPDVVALADRAAAGEASRRETERPARAAGGSSVWTRAPLDAWLAGVAAFAALVGLAVGREGLG